MTSARTKRILEKLRLHCILFYKYMTI